MTAYISEDLLPCAHLGYEPECSVCDEWRLSQRIVDPTKSPLIWPKPPELEAYKRGREAGTISIFRSFVCAVCRILIPKSYVVCTAKCALEYFLAEERGEEERRKRDEAKAEEEAKAAELASQSQEHQGIEHDQDSDRRRTRSRVPSQREVPSASSTKATRGKKRGKAVRSDSDRGGDDQG